MSSFGTILLRPLRAAAFASVLVAATVLNTAGRAAVSPVTEPVSPSQLEIIVVETEGCIYCHLFRRDVLPSFETSQRAKSVPIRFMDLKDVDSGSLGLDGPIESVPTVLVLKRHKEIGRIPGYVGPTNFFLSINRLLSAGE